MEPLPGSKSVLIKFRYSENSMCCRTVTFKQNSFLSFSENNLKMMKNGFYFILKAFFVLKIFALLS